MTNHRLRWTALLAALCLVAAACGGDDDDSAAEETTTTAVTETTDEDTTDDEEPLIEARELDVAVEYAGFEYELIDLELIEQDPSLPAFGSNFAVNVTAINLSDRTRMPNPEVNLQWDDANDNVVQSRAQLDMREVPGESSGSGTFLFNVSPDDAEEFDDASARIVIGSSGSAQAVVPLGDDTELVSLLPVRQDITGAFDLDGLTFEIEAAWVRWDNPGEGTQVDEGTAILELWGPMVNGTEAQHCLGSTRGRTEPVITLTDGTSRTFLGSNVNCLTAGETERDTVIAFEIDDPFEGEHEVTIEGGSQLEASDTITFDLVDSEGETLAQRDAARDGDLGTDEDDDEDTEDDEDEDDES